MTCHCPTCGQAIQSDVVIFDAGAGIVIGNGIVVSLPRRESRILDYLWQRPGKMVSKDTLFDAIYDILDEPEGGANLIESHMSKMRRKVKAAGVIIRSERFKGYQLLAGGRHG